MYLFKTEKNWIKIIRKKGEIFFLFLIQKPKIIGNEDFFYNNKINI